jgi:hypothetical protein
MPRTASPRTVAIRDQLLAILRAEYPMPLSTNDILLKMANGGQNCDSYLSTDGRCARPERCRAWCWYSRVYPQLVALINLKLVERIRPPEMRAAYWRYVPDDQDDGHFNAIINAMEDTDA